MTGIPARVRQVIKGYLEDPAQDDDATFGSVTTDQLNTTPIRGRVHLDGSTVVAKNLLNGNLWEENDIVPAMNNLIADISTRNGGPGGRILIENGTYVTTYTNTHIELDEGVYVDAESIRGVTIKYADDHAPDDPYPFFLKEHPNATEGDMGVRGILFDCNRANQTISTQLASSAAQGDTQLDVKNADVFNRNGLKHSTLVISDTTERYPRQYPGKDVKGYSSIDFSNDTITLDSGLDRSFSADDYVRFYPMLGGVELNNVGPIVVTECEVYETHDQAAIRHSGGQDDEPKVFMRNRVYDQHGSTGVRIGGSVNAVVAENVINQGDYGYPGSSNYWMEGVSIEQTDFSICRDNIIRGNHGRCIRANYGTNTQVTGNIVHNDEVEVYDFEAPTNTWSALRGDETLSDDTNQVAEGNESLEVVGGTSDNPGVEASAPSLDYWFADGLQFYVRSQATGVDFTIEFEDGDGTTYSQTFTGSPQDTWHRVTLPFAPPSGFDQRNVSTVRIYANTTTDNFRFNLDRMWYLTTATVGVTVFSGDAITVSNNTFYGIGDKAADMQNCDRLSMTGNTVENCRYGFSQDSPTSGTISDNTFVGTDTAVGGAATAVGNVVVDDTGQGAISADQAIGNLVIRPDEKAVVGGYIQMGNRVVNPAGGNAIFADQPGVSAFNYITPTADFDLPALATGGLLEEGDQEHLFFGNYAEHGTVSVETGAAVAAFNVLEDTGGGNTVFPDNGFWYNHGDMGGGELTSPVSATLTSGSSPAARINGIYGRENAMPEVRVVPDETTTPNADFSIDAYPEWDDSAGAWDLVVEWRTDPGSDFDITAYVDIPFSSPNA